MVETSGEFVIRGHDDSTFLPTFDQILKYPC